MSDHLVTPVARLVSGSLSDRNKTDWQNQPIPEDKQRFEFGIAIRKDDPKVNDMLQAVMQKALAEYGSSPQIQTVIQQFSLASNSGFSWKMKDGDAPNREGKTNANTVGHWVLYFSSSYLVKTHDATNKELDISNFERGCFVQVAFNVSGNNLTTNLAGIYLNPTNVKFIAYGEPIKGGMDGETAFGGVEVPQQLPAGASLTPVATGGMAGVAPTGTLPETGQSNTAPALPTAQPTAQPNTNSTTGYPTNNQQPQAAPLQGFSNGETAPAQSGMPVIPTT